LSKNSLRAVDDFHQSGYAGKRMEDCQDQEREVRRRSVGEGGGKR